MAIQFNSVDIFGVRVDKVTMDEAVGLVEEWLNRTSSGKAGLRGARHYIVTPNMEFVVAAQKDKEFKDVLNKADLSIPDGWGLKLASDIESIIAGVDLLERLCREASKKGFTVGFLGGRDGVAKEAAECLQKKYPGLKVVLAEGGGEVDMDGLQLTDYSFRQSAVSSQQPAIDLLFVAFGQIKQEKWIAKNLPHIPVKVAMGVGGSFDELSGRIPRIPSFVHKIGLKWLVRLILQPWRIKRQLALFRFIWKVLISRWP